MPWFRELEGVLRDPALVRLDDGHGPVVGQVAIELLQQGVLVAVVRPRGSYEGTRDLDPGPMSR